MKRVKYSDIRFKVNPKLVYVKNFTMRFYTVSSRFYFFEKTEQDVIEVEREATVDDVDVILSGGTKVTEYYIPIEWDELLNVGEGVLNYRVTNNIEDPEFPDHYYNKEITVTTDFYIDCDIHVDPEPAEGLIERIVALEEHLATEIVDRETADSFISGAVDTEIARAISAETELSEALTSETNRAISAETELSNAIINETNRATSAETALSSKIDADVLAEENRAKAAETALDGKITSVSGAVSTEVARAISAETALQTAIDELSSGSSAAIDAEIARATSAETQLGNRIDSEASARTNADTALSNKIDSLSGTVDTKLADKADKVDAVASAEYVSSAKTINLKNISGTVISTIDATDFIKDGMVDDVKIENGYLVITFNTDAGKESISIALTDIFNPNNYYTKTEIDNTVSGINTSIANEVSARTDADTAINGKIEVVSGNVISETSRATTAENALSGAIDSVSAITSGDVETLTQAIANEVSRATSAENVLSGAIDSISAATSGSVEELDSKITSVSGAVSTEVARAISAETAISGAVDTKLAISDFNTYSGAVDTLINSKASQSTVEALNGVVTAHIADTSIHFTTGTVQTLIDESISGKANSSDVYLKSETSGATEIATALNQKLSISDFNTYSGNVDTALSGKQDTLVSGTNIKTINNESILGSGNITIQGDTVDGTSLFGAKHSSNRETSIKYFSQTIEGTYPIALKFVVGNGKVTYSSAITIGLYDTEHWNDHYNTLTISSSGGVVTSITEANGGSFTGITVDSDWVLRPAEGYVFSSYQWLIKDYILGLRILSKDGVIESGSTTDVIENGIYKQLQRHEENIGNLSISAVTSTKLSFKDESGITLTTNASSTALAVDDSLKYVGKLGVYVTGDTHTNVFNSESATIYLMLDGIKNVDMWLNQSYTGTPSGWYTIQVRNLDNTYDYYLYENNAFTLVTGSAGSTLNYDSSTGKITITCPSGIASLQNGSKFAPKDDLTNADCFIGLVSYTSNEYPLQKVIDNLLDYIDTLKNNNIDKFSAQYDSETDTWYLSGGEY